MGYGLQQQEAKGRKETWEFRKESCIHNPTTTSRWGSSNFNGPPNSPSGPEAANLNGFLSSNHNATR